MNQHYQKRPFHKNRHVEINVPPFDDQELLGTRSEDLARELADKTQLTTHQLRRFYGEIKNIERLLNASTDSQKAWNKAYSQLKLTKAKAFYNAARQQNKLPEEFKQFIAKCVDRIPADYETGTKQFGKFCQLFEAIVGYSKQYTDRREQRHAIA